MTSSDGNNNVNSSDDRKGCTLENVENLYGMPLDELYKVAIRFYKKKERSGELQMEYPNRLMFMAYFKQAKYGVFKEEAADCGWLDLVGNDARKQWKQLGTLSVQQAMLEFVRLLDVVCPTFHPHITECREMNASKSIKQHEDISFNSADSEQVLLKFQQQRQQIQEALNKQTYHQFLAYAQQTHPGELEKQEELIKQLQEQHYEQYMSQVCTQQQGTQVISLLETTSMGVGVPSAKGLKQSKEMSESASSTSSSQVSTNSAAASNLSSSDSEKGQRRAADVYLQQGLERPLPRHKHRVKRVNEDVGDGSGAKESDVSDEDEEDGAAADDAPPNPKIAPASLWNSKNIQEFKDTIRKEGPESILKIGHGETVTVRVPTHEEGLCLFWEFATDYYDIGFGVYFEWTIADSNQVTVHVSESSDEEYDEDELEGAAGRVSTTGGDVESGGGPAGGASPAVARRQRRSDPNKPPIDEIIPVYRRDSHEEVFAGSHMYPGRGVYLLKFDNSFSLWRSKTLYYRVFYSK